MPIHKVESMFFTINTNMFFNKFYDIEICENLFSESLPCLLNSSDVIVRLDVVGGEVGQVGHHMIARVTEAEEVVVETLGMEVEVAGTGDQVACSRVVVRWTNRKPHLQSQLQSVE